MDKEINQIVAFDAKVMEQPYGRCLSLETISSWFSENQEVFGLPFKSSKVAVYSPEFTVLPDKTERPKDIFQLSGYPESEEITYLKNRLGDTFYVYYSLPDKTINYIENHLPNVEFYCCDFGLLNFYNQKLSFRQYLACHIYGEELTICYKKDGQNHYYNKFSVKAKEDLLYYIRLTYEQSGLNLNEFPTYLYGFIEEKSPMYSTSYGYIRNLEIDRTLKNTLPFLYGIEEIPLHYYINLLGLGL